MTRSEAAQRSVETRIGYKWRHIVRLRAAGYAWCSGCHAWHVKEYFSPDHSGRSPTNTVSQCRYIRNVIAKETGTNLRAKRREAKAKKNGHAVRRDAVTDGRSDSPHA